jgi:hypothetical protein
MFLMLVIGMTIGVRISGRLSPVEGQAKPGTGFAAVPGALGGEDLTGAYDVVKNWPKDVSSLPGNEKWTYGAGEISWSMMRGMLAHWGVLIVSQTS